MYTDTYLRSRLDCCAGIYPFVSLGAPDVAATFVEGLHEPQVLMCSFSIYASSYKCVP